MPPSFSERRTDCQLGDAGYAVSFQATNHPRYSLRELPNVREVKLNGGVDGLFRPVKLWGAHAPLPNLWWEQGTALYQIQLKLSSTVPEKEHEATIAAVANSAIVAGPREVRWPELKRRR